MSVLIRGMEMPKACYECRMYEADIYYCTAAERDIDIPSSDEGRCSFCPLVPVPPHGDLIDKKTVSENLASVLNKKNPPFSYPDWNDAIVAMLTAPTIIPAEEE